MPAATLTTTLSELNRFYGVYFDVVNKKTSNSQEQNDTRKNVPWRKNELFFLFDEVTWS